MIFFHRSGFDLSTLSHFSAGGQLLHPSEVKSSMSELCVSPLSNVVAGGDDPGCSANRLELPIRRVIARAPIDFILVDLKLAGVTAPGYRPRVRQPRSLLFRLITQRPFVSANDHRLAVRWRQY